jgi:hypothetical protein
MYCMASGFSKLPDQDVPNGLDPLCFFVPYRSCLLFSSSISFQLLAQCRHDAMGLFDILDPKPVRETVDPRGLLTHRVFVRAHSFLRQHDEWRPPMVRIRLEGDQALLFEIVDNALNILAVRSQIAREPGDRLRPVCSDDGAENLPAGTRQAKPSD